MLLDFTQKKIPENSLPEAKAELGIRVLLFLDIVLLYSYSKNIFHVSFCKVALHFSKFCEIIYLVLYLKQIHRD